MLVRIWRDWNTQVFDRNGNQYNRFGKLHGSENEVTQSCPTLCDPMDCSLPGSSIHRIFQARVLEWLSFSSPEFPWLKPIPGVCFILIHNLSYRWFLPLFSFHSTSHPGKKVRWPRNYPDWNLGSPKAKPLSLTHPGTEGPRSLIQLALEGKLRSVHQGHT